MQSLLVSWKTTAAGVGSIASAIALLLSDITAIDGEVLSQVVGLIVVGVGLLTARDADKSSRQQGVR